MNNTTIAAYISDNISDTLRAIPYLANIWITIFFWVTGNIGCIGNIIVFQSSTFRNRASTVYLFFETVADAFLINFVLVTRILQKGFQIPVINRYTVICKLRQFSTDYFNQISFNSFTFATIDRILSAQRSNLYRKWSNHVIMAYKMVIIYALFWFLFTGHRLILYNATNNTCGLPIGVYRDYDSYSEVATVGIFPLFTMFALAFLLIKSVRTVIKRQAISGVRSKQIKMAKRSNLEQMDSQLILMLMLQSIVAIITFFPYATELADTAITETWYKSPLRLAIEKIVTEITHIFAYTFYVTSFYISLISINGFRRKIKRILRITKKHHSNGTIALANINKINSQMNSK